MNQTELLRTLERHYVEIETAKYSDEASAGFMGGTHAYHDSGTAFIPFYSLATLLAENPELLEYLSHAPLGEPAPSDRLISDLSKRLFQEVQPDMKKLIQYCESAGYLSVSDPQFRARQWGRSTLGEVFSALMASDIESENPFLDLEFAFGFFRDFRPSQLVESLASRIDSAASTTEKMFHQNELASITSRLHEISIQYQRKADDIRRAHSISQSIQFTDILKALEELRSGFGAIAAGCPNGDLPTLDLLSQKKWFWLKNRSLSLLQLIRDGAASRLTASAVLGRYKVFTEKFEREAITREAAGSKGRVEKICQLHLERFLFLQGITPLVHAEAVDGRWDLLAEDKRLELLHPLKQPKLAELPVLIELKQTLGGELESATKVNSVLAAAMAQAEIYRQFAMNIFPRRSLATYVMVFYDGPTRWNVSQRNDATIKQMLIYLGETPPSRAKLL